VIAFRRAWLHCVVRSSTSPLDDQHGLADARPAEHPDLAALRERSAQVECLDAGEERARGRLHVGELRGRTVNRTPLDVRWEPAVRPVPALNGRPSRAGARHPAMEIAMYHTRVALCQNRELRTNFAEEAEAEVLATVCLAH